VAKIAQTINQIKMYPNPAEKEITLEYIATAGGACIVTVQDITGRIVWKFTEKQQMGNNQLKLTLGNLAKGSYFINISNVDFNHTETLHIK